MQNNANIQLIQKIYRDFLDGNLDAVLDVFAEDIDWGSTINWPGGPTNVPYEGERIGRENVARALKQFLEMVRYEKATAHTHTTAIGNRVIVTGQELRRDLSTGDLTENRWSMIWTIEDGKVSHFRMYQDTVEMLE